MVPMVHCAIAPKPSPLIITLGAVVYPLPELIIAIETIRPLITMGCARAPSPELTLTEGSEVYPLPKLVILTLSIVPRTSAFASAPSPPPPVIETLGCEM